MFGLLNEPHFNNASFRLAFRKWADFHSWQKHGKQKRRTISNIRLLKVIWCNLTPVPCISEFLKKSQLSQTVNNNLVFYFFYFTEKHLVLKLNITIKSHNHYVLWLALTWFLVRCTGMLTIWCALYWVSVDCVLFSFLVLIPDSLHLCGCFIAVQSSTVCLSVNQSLITIRNLPYIIIFFINNTWQLLFVNISLMQNYTAFSRSLTCIRLGSACHHQKY